MNTKYTFCNEKNLHLSLVCGLSYFLFWELLLFSRHLTIFLPPKDKVLRTYIIFLCYFIDLLLLVRVQNNKYLLNTY